MSLTPGELRTPAKIDSQLSRSDPWFAAMFAGLTAKGIRNPIARWRVRRCQARPDSRTRIIIAAAGGVLRRR